MKKKNRIQSQKQAYTVKSPTRLSGQDAFQERSVATVVYKLQQSAHKIKHTQKINTIIQMKVLQKGSSKFGHDVVALIQDIHRHRNNFPIGKLLVHKGEEIIQVRHSD